MRNLNPLPRLGWRLAFWLALIGLASIGNAAWGSKLLFVLSMALVVGTFRQAWIGDGRFERQLVVGFVPMRRRSWALDRFVEIQARWEGGSAIEWSLLIGGGTWILLRLFDWLFPWFGGAFELRLRSAAGRVLVWQGNSEFNFDANCKALELATGLPVVRK